MINPFLTVDGIGDDLGVEVVYPYCDREVIEFVLGLPYYYTMENAEQKLLTRNAFARFWPEGYKPKQGDYYRLIFKGLEEHWIDIRDSVANSPLCDSGIISRNKALEFLTSWRCGKQQDSVQALHTLLAACYWIKLGGWKF